MSDNQQGAKITVYWLEKSRSQRIIWLLEELNLDYEVKVFKRDENFRAQDDLRQVHPLGRSPVIGITPADSEKEIIIAESETIIDYVCEHFGKHLIPKKWAEGKEGAVGGETEEWMRYKFLMDYTEGSFFTPLIVALITSRIRTSPVPFFLKPITGGIASKVDDFFTNPELKSHCEFLENYLATPPSNGEFFCGDSLTGADIMLHFALEGATKRVPLSETSYPKLYTYMRKLQQRDAYKRAGERVEKESGVPYVPYSDV
ncbi:glutathione transferase [Dothidotthia symphoricarpi CBS 119687]|uniref:glutathione transferase n=1 Tax=Dothidotthia symphoricarpi CBS 119687 TaxID=1392245 RepID=A0A6A5ZVY6_9PLEO|nr:glutathione transferase [Dothidotthia symphoricarpi CBS 119687]KAF2123456.1 glutathione transferase [Dothidotthia symphoricarpi CBS 119687]